jgi:anti-sigma B factor antagonist
MEMTRDGLSFSPGGPTTAIHVVPEGDAIVAICMEGEIDLINAPELLQYAEQAIELHRHLVFDLSDATFLDSSAIHAMITARAHAENAGCITVLQMGTAATVERAIEITGVEQVMPRVTSRGEAIETIHRLEHDRS